VTFVQLRFLPVLLSRAEFAVMVEIEPSLSSDDIGGL